MVVDAQLALKITLGREVVLYPEAVLEIEVEKLFVTFFASLWDRSLARELMLVLLGELFSLVVMTCSLNFCWTTSSVAVNSTSKSKSF